MTMAATRLCHRQTSRQWQEVQWRRWSGNDGCGGGRWQRGTTMAMADNNSSGQEWWRTTTVCEIGQRTMTGKDESGLQETAETAE
jgi:hypothetical protein